MKDLTPNSINKSFKLWSVCAHDEMRPVLNMIHFINGHAYATDARVLVKLPYYLITNMEEEEAAKLNGYCIDAKAYKLLSEIGPITLDNSDGLTAKGWIDSAEVAIRFHDHSTLKPLDFEAVLKLTQEITPIDGIGVDQSALKRLTDAIGDDRVKMGFVDQKSKIYVVPLKEEFRGALGIIMPIMITPTIEGF